MFMDQLALERHLLGTILTYGGEALERITDLAPEDFAASVHGEIFRTLRRLHADGLPLDYATLGAELSGNSAAINALKPLDGAESLTAIQGHAIEVRRLATIRTCVRIGQEIVNCGRALPSGASATLAALERLISRLVDAVANRNASVISISEVATEHIELIDRVARGEPAPERVSTGLRDVDRVLCGGFQKGELPVFAGATSSGKSSLAGQVTVHAATRPSPSPVAFVTTEMTHKHMLARLVAAEFGIPVGEILSPRAAVKHRNQISQLGKLPIWFQAQFPPLLEQAAAAIRSLARSEGAKLAVIDYAQRLASLETESQEHETARVISTAKNLALELQIVVIACAQVNRQPDGRADRRPRLTDLRGSGRIEQESDHVLFTFRPEQHGHDGAPEIIVAKNRNGPTEIVQVRWNGRACRFESIEPEPSRRCL
jgi:replicative DNA helicase